MRRKHPPLGWALPGGFVEAGESAAAAARRELREETAASTSSSPISSTSTRTPPETRADQRSAWSSSAGGDDTAEARVFPIDALPAPLAFDHALILADYRRYRREGQRPLPDR